MSLSRETPPCDCHYDVRIAFFFLVRACPEFVSVARVECAINEISIKPNTSLDQVLIHGDCQNISEYIRLCVYEINVIIMQSTGERFLCSGNFNLKKKAKKKKQQEIMYPIIILDLCSEKNGSRVLI